MHHQHTLRDHFAPFRQNIIGQDAKFETPYGVKKSYMQTGQQAVVCINRSKMS